MKTPSYGASRAEEAAARLADLKMEIEKGIEEKSKAIESVSSHECR